MTKPKTRQQKLVEKSRALANENFNLRTSSASLVLENERLKALLAHQISQHLHGAHADKKVVPMENSMASEIAVDAVNHPPHYTLGGIEVIDAIEAWGLGFNLGNSVKYLARAGRKDPSKTVEDLRKALFYLEREIGLLTKNKVST
jgi:hypothetical protein